MEYFKTEDKLIQFNPSTNVYRFRNTIQHGDKTLSKEEFDALNSVKIKKQKFCELMNNYFKDINHEWKFEHSNYRKMDNFSNDFNDSGSQWIKVPFHKVEGLGFNGNKLKFVYHWGRVYYIIYGGHYAPKGQLLDVNTLKILQWVHIKNVAPIFNVGTKKIV
jgi:hypothetical protein